MAEAPRTAAACLDYLIPVAPGLPAAACGEALAAVGEVRSKLAAAHAVLLRRFDALDGQVADGYGSAWLAAMTKMTRKDAKAAAGTSGASLEVTWGPSPPTRCGSGAPVTPTPTTTATTGRSGSGPRSAARG